MFRHTISQTAATTSDFAAVAPDRHRWRVLFGLYDTTCWPASDA
jgi:hypothetical protein